MTEPEEPTPLEVLSQAVQAFVNTQVDRPTIVDSALLLWEEVSYDDDGDGDVQRSMNYANTTDNFSLSSALGLLEASREHVRRDILGERECGEH